MRDVLEMKANLSILPVMEMDFDPRTNGAELEARFRVVQRNFRLDAVPVHTRIGVYDSLFYGEFRIRVASSRQYLLEKSTPRTLQVSATCISR